MNLLAYISVNVVETLVRFVPLRAQRRLIKIGAPDRRAPVFLTGNYHLTVARVRRALRRLDCYLLVANSRGHNVWCGAAGGHFTHHDVISALRTSGVEDLVDHRTVVLPQLAAAGIEAALVRKKAGWRVIWGPVYAKDIPAFVADGFKKSAATRGVRFALGARLEMAVVWAFPFAAVAALIIIPLWRRILLPLMLAIWGLSFLIFALFPLYARWLRPRRRGIAFSKYTVIFDFGRTLLILWAAAVLLLVAGNILTAYLGWAGVLRWGLVAFIVVLLLSIDLMGSTPTYKSGLHEDRFLKVVLDKERCKGAGFCEEVCPRNCYEVDRERHTASLARPERCVQCGGCIVQCPYDALSFRGPAGEVLPPATIRKYKLNLLGKRIAAVPGEGQ